MFYFPKIRDLFHMKLFVDTDSDTRLARRGNSARFLLFRFSDIETLIRRKINVSDWFHSTKGYKRERERPGLRVKPIHEFCKACI